MANLPLNANEIFSRRRCVTLMLLLENHEGRSCPLIYYEGGETMIYRCEPDKIEPVLSVACGA